MPPMMGGGYSNLSGLLFESRILYQVAFLVVVISFRRFVLKFVLCLMTFPAKEYQVVRIECDASVMYVVRSQMDLVM